MNHYHIYWFILFQYRNNQEKEFRMSKERKMTIVVLLAMAAGVCVGMAVTFFVILPTW